MGRDLFRAFGPEAKQTANTAGGRQSESPCALDVVPLALLRVGNVLYRGEAKNEDAPQLVGQENWRKISSREHARHMLNHLILYLAGDGEEEHIEHTVARGLFIIERDNEPTEAALHGDDHSPSGTRREVAAGSPVRAGHVGAGPRTLGGARAGALLYDGE